MVYDLSKLQLFFNLEKYFRVEEKKITEKCLTKIGSYWNSFGVPFIWKYRSI